jgi:hypothetical protein
MFTYNKVTIHRANITRFGKNFKVFEKKFQLANREFRQISVLCEVNLYGANPSFCMTENKKVQIFLQKFIFSDKIKVIN